MFNYSLGANKGAFYSCVLGFSQVWLKIMCLCIKKIVIQKGLEILNNMPKHGF
jgi:hypothetical protein